MPAGEVEVRCVCGIYPRAIHSQHQLIYAETLSMSSVEVNLISFISQGLLDSLVGRIIAVPFVVAHPHQPVLHIVSSQPSVAVGVRTPHPIRRRVRRDRPSGRWATLRYILRVEVTES